MAAVGVGLVVGGGWQLWGQLRVSVLQVLLSDGGGCCGYGGGCLAENGLLGGCWAVASGGGWDAAASGGWVVLVGLLVVGWSGRSSWQ